MCIRDSYYSDAEYTERIREAARKEKAAQPVLEDAFKALGFNPEALGREADGKLVKPKARPRTRGEKADDGLGKEAVADRSPRAHQYGSLWLKFIWLIKYAALIVVRKVGCRRSTALVQIVASQRGGICRHSRCQPQFIIFIIFILISTSVSIEINDVVAVLDPEAYYISKHAVSAPHAPSPYSVSILADRKESVQVGGPSQVPAATAARQQNMPGRRDRRPRRRDNDVRPPPLISEDGEPDEEERPRGLRFLPGDERLAVQILGLEKYQELKGTHHYRMDKWSRIGCIGWSMMLLLRHGETNEWNETI